MSLLFPFLWGTILGSFLNVLIYRLPRNISIIHPRSFCPSCNTVIPFSRNIPLFSYLIQLGACHNCGIRISVRYPLVEAMTGFLFIVGITQFHFPEGIFFILLTSILLVIMFIDAQKLIIPLPLLLFGMLIIILYNIFYSHEYWIAIQGAIVGSAYILIVFGILWLTTKKQTLGLGDVLLITFLGSWLGPIKIIITIFFAALFALFHWSIITLVKGFKKDLKIPFGTHLSGSGIIINTFQLSFLDLLVH